MAFIKDNSGNLLVDSSGIFLGFDIPTLPTLPNFSLDNYKYGSGTQNQVLSLGGGGSFDSNRILHPCVVEHSGTVYLFYSGYNGSVWQIGLSTGSVFGFNGVNFNKIASNPVLSNGTIGSWDAGGVLDPWVMFDPIADEWKMWFRGISGSSLTIGYATAPSPFGTWTKYVGNPILEHDVGWEGNIVMMPNVSKIGDVIGYRMMFSGNEPASNNARIGYALSDDGIDWTKYENNPVLNPSGSGWMAVSVFSPRTLYLQNGIYKLYYSAKQVSSGASKCGYAYSNDLITWTVDAVNPIITATRTWEGTEVENPNAIHIGTNWYIYYDCYFGSPSTIGVAVVPD